jgi:hypothetical protein
MLADSRRYEDAARLRDRIRALEQVVDELAALERLRAAELCLVAPALENGAVRTYFVAAGRIAAARTVHCHAGASLEIDGALAEARLAGAIGPSFAPESADELLLVAGFVRRPPPELTVVPFDRGRILAACRKEAIQVVA